MEEKEQKIKEAINEIKRILKKFNLDEKLYKHLEDCIDHNGNLDRDCVERKIVEEFIE
jgi:hypothetical protein